jgi:microcystin-dependent protein
MAHTDSYTEADVTDNTDVIDIDDKIIDTRRMFRERLAIDHKFASSDDADVKYGVHKKVTFEADIASPSPATGQSCLYPKTGDYDSELRYLDENGVDSLIIIVGEVRMILSSTIPDGWLALNGETIGSAASGSDNADDDLLDLFTVLWDELTDSESPILDSGGGASSRGADAASVGWAANKRLTLPDSRARMPIGAGTDGVLTDRTIGDTGGDEEKTLTHVHDLNSHTHGTSGTHSHVWFDYQGVGATDKSGDGTAFGATSQNSLINKYTIGTGLSYQDNGGYDIDKIATQDLSTSTESAGITTAAAVGDTLGPVGDEDVMNPWLALTFIIKY